MECVNTGGAVLKRNCEGSNDLLQIIKQQGLKWEINNKSAIYINLIFVWILIYFMTLYQLQVIWDQIRLENVHE